MEDRQMTDILKKMGFKEHHGIHRFQSEEDEAFYNAWKIDTCDVSVVLKEAKGHEVDTYLYFFSGVSPWAPHLLGTVREGERDYILLEYIPGKNLRCCDRDSLTKVLDSLIAMQSAWWDHPAPEKGYHYLQSMAGRRNRRNYLADAQLEAAYDAYLKEYERVPRTLCHDDLLPFNVLQNSSRTVFIDWEYGGILPYLTSLARFLAHGEEQDGAFFYMTEADKAFAADYYYQNLVREKGISYPQYMASFRLFLFYEYCEWIYVGNKYKDTASPRFRSYFAKAKRLAEELGF